MVRAAFNALEMPLAGSRAVIQGFGKVGGPLAFLLSSAGMRVVAVSDVGGAIYNPAGLDVGALSDHVAASGSVVGFEQAEPLAADELFAVECELAVPAALAGVIDEHVAETLGARGRGRGGQRAHTAGGRPGARSTRKSSSSLTSSPTRAASPRRTSSGPRAARATPGTRTLSRPGCAP